VKRPRSADGGRGRHLAWSAGLVAFLPVAGEAAQVEVSAAVDTDYQIQGVSLSDGEPAVSLSLALEGRNGVYGGLTAVTDETRRVGLQPLALIGYAGYARRLEQDGAWDIGVLETVGALQLSRRYAFNYTQVYGGFSRGGISVHLFYSPSYLGEGAQELYLDLSGAMHPAAHWRLFGHVGAFALLDSSPEDRDDRSHLDVRVGLAREFGPCEIRVMWTATSRAVVYPTQDRQAARALLVGATYSF
jgi:uncharacterized protein (TIGR02001 family)